MEGGEDARHLLAAKGIEGTARLTLAVYIAFAHSVAGKGILDAVFLGNAMGVHLAQRPEKIANAFRRESRMGGDILFDVLDRERVQGELAPKSDDALSILAPIILGGCAAIVRFEGEKTPKLAFDRWGLSASGSALHVFDPRALGKPFGIIELPQRDERDEGLALARPSAQRLLLRSDLDEFAALFPLIAKTQTMEVALAAATPLNLYSLPID